MLHYALKAGEVSAVLISYADVLLYYALKAGEGIAVLISYADVLLHTPCFTLIEQALSVFFNVNYI